MEFHFHAHRFRRQGRQPRALGHRRIERFADQRAEDRQAFLEVRLAGKAFAPKRFLHRLELVRGRQQAPEIEPVAEADRFQRAMQGVAEARAGEARALQRRRLDFVLGAARFRARVFARQLRKAVHPPVAIEQALHAARRRQFVGRQELQPRQVRDRGRVDRSLQRDRLRRARLQCGQRRVHLQVAQLLRQAAVGRAMQQPGQWRLQHVAAQAPADPGGVAGPRERHVQHAYVFGGDLVGFLRAGRILAVTDEAADPRQAVVAAGQARIARLALARLQRREGQEHQVEVEALADVQWS